MNDLAFFHAREALPLGSVAALGSATLPQGCDATLPITGAAPLERAGAGDVALAGDDLAEIATARASACFVTERQAAWLPSHVVALVTEDPEQAFNEVASRLHPDAAAPHLLGAGTGRIDPTAIVHQDARLEPEVTIGPGVVVGPGVEIGSGTSVGANTTIGADVRIGRACAIDAQVSLSHALLGDRVVIQGGVRIGQAGLAETGGTASARRVDLGRVIIQNDVCIGANASVSRGRLKDTVLGEGCRIPALATVAGDALVARGAVFPERS